MRLPLVSELVSRDGTTDRDATLKNGLVEINGDQAVTRKRPGMQDAGPLVPVLLRFLLRGKGNCLALPVI